MATSSVRQGTGWVLFAGVMLVLAGVTGALDGLWAIVNGDEQVRVIEDGVILWDSSLTTWGWIYLIGGIIVILAGFGVVSGAEWARAVGIFVAALWIVVRIPWVFTFPIATLIGIFLAVLVIYGLAVYGGRQEY
ncbi:MAG TPA: hypothetical protein VF152_07775 [Acidimicrobiia bacterium]